MCSLNCMSSILKYYGRSCRLSLLLNGKICIDVSKRTGFANQLCLHVSTMPVAHAKAAHTTKGWKFLARDGERLDRNSEELVEKCEEGNGAVLHAELIAKLQNCDSVASQIETFSSLLSLTPEDLERRKAFCESFDEAFKIYFPHFKVYLFGSSLNGLGFKGCDTDVCFQTRFDDKDFLLLKEVPSLNSVLDGTVSQDTISRLNPLYMLRFVRRILRCHCPNIKEPILLVKARCPLLRFYDAKYDVFCDFTCESKFSLQNTKLLHFICNLEPRFAPLAKIIRYWGKYGGFVGDIDRFNSYSFSLLVVHFLQVIHPPVLPPVKEILNKSEYLRSGSVDDKDMLLKDLQNFSPSKNTQTVEELLKEFYFYYLNYDYSRIMQPFTSTSIHKSSFTSIKDAEDIFELNSVSIQDPFRHSFNATAAASFKSCKRFLHGIIQSCMTYQDETLWVPRREMWGLCSLFQLPLSELKITEHWRNSTLHVIEVPASPDAAKKLKKIFEYGLLFHCKEFYMNVDQYVDSDSKPILKFHCTSYVNTWQGRYWYSQRFKENKDMHPLEIEHSISTELSNKSENKKQILCEFLCECSEISKNNQTVLRLTLNFKESKFPPVVAIFLKDYIPFIFRNL